MSPTDTAPPDGAKRGAQGPAPPEAGATGTKPKATPRRKKRFGPVVIVACLLALGGAYGWYWWQQQLHALPPGIASANGRLESEQVEIATKYPGRIAVVLAKEGQMVDKGEVLARMDTVELQAQLQAAQAAVRRAEQEREMAQALIVQKESERTLAVQELQRTINLRKEGLAPTEQLDVRQSNVRVAQAAIDTAHANLDAAKATIAADEAEVARLQSQINDSTLVAPVGGRIEYKLAQPGEVLSAGGRVFTLLDLSDVYMTVFYPAQDAGRLSLGDEARVTLDPVPGYVFPAKVTFVATEAQFTPKTVETAEERAKLMFRVKLTIDPALRTRYENEVKTGIRGIGFVRTDPHVVWPSNLTVKLP